MTDVGTEKGQVYVFNVTSQDVTLSLNGGVTDGGVIPGWAQSGATKYQPAVQPVKRVLNASDGLRRFFNGTNNVMINCDDGMFFAYIKIDGAALPLNQDVLLFIDRTRWHLVNQYAAEIASGDVTPASVVRQGMRLAGV